MSMESPGFANQADSYSAEQSRRAIFSPYARTSANSPGIISGGLLSTSDMQLSAAASGLVVDISTGEAIIGGSEGGAQGGYYARNSSTTSITLATANGTNPRIDTICCTIADSGYTEPTGVSGDAAVLQAVTGTPTAGATLSNLDGVASLPKSSLLLGYVLVPASATNLTSGDIANKATVVGMGASALYSPQLLSAHTCIIDDNAGAFYSASLGTISSGGATSANFSTTRTWTSAVPVGSLQGGYGSWYYSFDGTSTFTIHGGNPFSSSQGPISWIGVVVGH